MIDERNNSNSYRICSKSTLGFSNQNYAFFLVIFLLSIPIIVNGFIIIPELSSIMIHNSKISRTGLSIFSRMKLQHISSSLQSITSSSTSKLSRLCNSPICTYTTRQNNRHESSYLTLQMNKESSLEQEQENPSQHTKNDDSSNDKEDFSFSFESLDKQGQWMNIDYDKVSIQIPTKTPSKENTGNEKDMLQEDLDQHLFSRNHSSPVETKLIRDRLVYIKRDDLLHLRNSNVSGNKARKMLSLNEIQSHDFPDVIVSYGGPQSNAMVALAAIVQSKNVELAQEQDRRLRKENAGSDDSNINDYEISSDGWITLDDQLDSNLKNNFNDDDDDDDDNDNEFNMLNENMEDSVDDQKPSIKRKRFLYYTKNLPRFLRNQPNGNLLRALTLGMEMIQVKNDVYNEMFGGQDGGSAIAPIDAPVPGNSLWVPQGGACGVASQGAKFMANEIVSFYTKQRKGIPLSICIPGGTCATAMLLSREINAILKRGKLMNGDSFYGDSDHSINDTSLIPDINVVVIPCVGDAAYALRQMKALDVSTGGNGRDDIPAILTPLKGKPYFRFGEPHPYLLETFTEMKDEHGVYLDLLYGVTAWNLIFQHWQAAKYDNSYESPIKGRQIMYVHSGGLEGVSSQLVRYKHKGLIEPDQVQN